MKKSVVILAISLLFLWGCSLGTSSKTVEKEKTEALEEEDNWTVEDFAIYDLDGNLYNYPVDETLELSSENEEDKKYQTKKGAKVGDSAKVALDEYDFTGMSSYVSGFYGHTRLDEDSVQKLDQDFREKYPSIKDQIIHSNEVGKYGLALVIYGKFIVDGDKLTPLETPGTVYGSNGTYFFKFIIRDGKITTILLENGQD